MYILIDCVFCALLFLNIVQYVKYAYLSAKLHVSVHKIWLYDLKVLVMVTFVRFHPYMGECICKLIYLYFIFILGFCGFV